MAEVEGSASDRGLIRWCASADVSEQSASMIGSQLGGRALAGSFSDARRASFSSVQSGGCAADSADLPILDVGWVFRQGRHLPRLATTAVPVDVRVAKRNKAQRKVA